MLNRDPARLAPSQPPGRAPPASRRPIPGVRGRPHGHCPRRQSRTRRARARRRSSARRTRSRLRAGAPEARAGLRGARLSHLAEQRADRDRRSGKIVGRSQRPAERVGELLVRHRVRRGEVHDPGERRCASTKRVRGGRRRRARPSSTTACRFRSGRRCPSLNGSSMRSSAPAVPREDDSLAEVDDADAGLASGLGGRLPGATDVGQESAAERRLLGQDLVAAIAVDADAAAQTKTSTGVARARRPSARASRWRRPRVEDLALARRGPALPDVLAAEVHDRVDACSRAASSSPAAGSQRISSGARRLASDEPDDLVPLGSERRNERRCR